MIQDRLSANSSNEELFNEAATIYNDALERAGYKEKLMYKPRNREHNQGRVRRRNIIWFNPPYNEVVKNPIEREFYVLIDKHFPRHHNLQPKQHLPKLQLHMEHERA